MGKLPQDETLRLKGPVLTQGSGWVNGHKGLCGWRKGQKWWGGGGKESAGIPGKREFNFTEGVSDWWYGTPFTGHRQI